MNKQDFLNILSANLKKYDAASKAEILYDYQEHFIIGLNQGKSEEEIIQGLGDPRAIAKQFNADSIVKQASETKSIGNITRAVFAIAGLGFFNLVFVLGPYIGLVGVLIGLFATAIGVIFTGVAFIIAVIVSPALPDFINLGGVNPGAIVFAGVGTTALGLLFFIGLLAVSRLFLKGTLNYLKMNIRIIKS